MSRQSLGRHLATVVVLAAGLIIASLAAVLLQSSANVSLVYPATGLAAALLWGFGMRWWPAAVIAQFVLSYRASGGQIPVATFVAATELLVVVLFCAVVLRLHVSRELGQLRDLAVFVAAAFVTSLAGGLATVIGELFLEPVPLRRLLFDGLAFWFSDFVSLLIFVPFVLGWRRWPFTSSRQFRHWLALMLLLALTGAAIALIGEPSSLFLLLPIVVFTSLVAGIPGAAAAGVALLFILLGVHGTHEPPRATAIITVIFVGTSAATGYVLAVVWSERERNARRLYHLAHHDPLTGLVNRHELERRLHEAVSDRSPAAHALLYLDLDQFKLVNDTCGHMAGDRMLEELSTQLQRAAPADAVFGRLGGDEFACILKHTTEEKAMEVANALHDAMARYRFHFGAMSFTVGGSIGITFFPAEGFDTADTVLGRADVACYMAKEDGRHRSHVYHPRDETMLAWHAAIQEVSQLEMAMSDGTLQLYQQAIVDLTGETDPHFCEVLLRLTHEGVVRPSAEFLPAAQRFGVMDRIDRWVLENVCRHVASSGDSSLRLSVNVSGSTLNDPSFYQDVISITGRYGVDPRQLCLEVTEGVMIHRLRQAVEAMQGLRERGFAIALDDFGAGVASFAYLQELPVTHVKIDGRIVRNLLTDPTSEVIISSLIRLAALRDIECIAEWVESAEVADRLRSLGIRYAQGFYLDMPSPLARAADAGFED